MIVLPIPCVKTDVKVEAGDVNPFGKMAAIPTTICIASASPNARAIPKTTAVKIPGVAALSKTREIVCHLVAPRQVMLLYRSWALPLMHQHSSMLLLVKS